MRQFKFALMLSILAIVSNNSLFAQVMKDPTTWTYEAKKTGNNQYQLCFSLKLNKGWHIYAMKPGGDGTIIAPSFEFDKNANLKINGSITEQGKLISETIEYVGKVNYYVDKVVYVQKISAATNTTITGTHSYQVCNDMMCLPPKNKTFSFTLK